MENFKHTNTFIFGDYQTDFYTEIKLHKFLLSESIPCLSCRFKAPENFYNTMIFRLPNGKENKNYKMIYFQSRRPKEYNILAEGSVKLMDTSLSESPTVNWIIINL